MCNTGYAPTVFGKKINKLFKLSDISCGWLVVGDLFGVDGSQ